MTTNKFIFNCSIGDIYVQGYGVDKYVDGDKIKLVVTEMDGCDADIEPMIFSSVRSYEKFIDANTEDGNWHDNMTQVVLDLTRAIMENSQQVRYDRQG